MTYNIINNYSLRLSIIITKYRIPVVSILGATSGFGAVITTTILSSPCPVCTCPFRISRKTISRYPTNAGYRVSSKRVVVRRGMCASPHNRFIEIENIAHYATACVVRTARTTRGTSFATMFERAWLILVPNLSSVVCTLNISKRTHGGFRENFSRNSRRASIKINYHRAHKLIVDGSDENDDEDAFGSEITIIIMIRFSRCRKIAIISLMIH